MKNFVIVVTVLLVGSGIGMGLAWFMQSGPEVGVPEGVMCTMDAIQCPNGAMVGRSGPNCEFVCPAGEMSELPVVPADVAAAIAAKDNLIRMTEPAPLEQIISPQPVQGTARGNWFFEGSFPIVLVNWDGLIIAEGIAKAEGEWMTEEFVPFKAELTFTSPVTADSPEFMSRGAIILKKDNPSGMPENDDALEIPIEFAPQGTVREPQGV
jgi:hypothetical protein